MDTTLLDIKGNGAWERGDVSFIFNPTSQDPSNNTHYPDSNSTGAKSSKPGSPIGSTNGHLVVLDNQKHVYQRLRHEYKSKKLEEDVDVLMSHDIVSVQMSTKPIQFNRAMSGWFFKSEKSVSDLGGLVLSG